MLPVQWRTLDLCTVPKWRNWQTRVVQVHVLARVWGFESLLRHHEIFYIKNCTNKLHSAASTLCMLASSPMVKKSITP